MPFSDFVKKEVKRKARYYCVWCKQVQIPLEVHHIVRESDGGDNSIDNAVPLCPTHHELFGHKPELQPMVRKMRDEWYEHCDKFLPEVEVWEQRYFKLEQEIGDLKQSVYKTNEELRSEFITFADTMVSRWTELKKKLIEGKPTPTTIAEAAVNTSGLTLTSGTFSSYATSSVGTSQLPKDKKRTFLILGLPKTNVRCPNGCFVAGQYQGPRTCPYCGAELIFE